MRGAARGGPARAGYSLAVSTERTLRPRYVPQDGPPRFAALRRLDDAFRAVQRAVAETTVPAGGPPAVWYVYNMGIVVKTAQSLFSVDLQHRFAEELAPSLDFALITHNHHDHYTRRFYDAMNGIQRKTVVSNFLDNYAAHFGKKAPGGFTRAEKIFTFKDVTGVTPGEWKKSH